MSPKPAVNLFRGKIFPGPRTTKFPSSSIFPHPTFVLDTRPLTDFSLEPFLNLSLDRFTTRKNGPPAPELVTIVRDLFPGPFVARLQFQCALLGGAGGGCAILSNGGLRVI